MAAARNNIIGFQFYGGKRITGARHITFHAEEDNKFKYKLRLKHFWMLTVSNTVTEEMSIYKKFKVYTESAAINIIDRNWSMNSTRLLTNVQFGVVLLVGKHIWMTASVKNFERCCEASKQWREFLVTEKKTWNPPGKLSAKIYDVTSQNTAISIFTARGTSSSSRDCWFSAAGELEHVDFQI
jgi:hypothetical protein